MTEMYASIGRERPLEPASSWGSSGVIPCFLLVCGVGGIGYAASLRDRNWQVMTSVVACAMFASGAYQFFGVSHARDVAVIDPPLNHRDLAEDDIRGQLHAYLPRRRVQHVEEEEESLEELWKEQGLQNSGLASLVSEAKLRKSLVDTESVAAIPEGLDSITHFKGVDTAIYGSKEKIVVGLDGNFVALISGERADETLPAIDERYEPYEQLPFEGWSTVLDAVHRASEEPPQVVGFFKSRGTLYGAYEGGGRVIVVDINGGHRAVAVTPNQPMPTHWLSADESDDDPSVGDHAFTPWCCEHLGRSTVVVVSDEVANWLTDKEIAELHRYWQYNAGPCKGISFAQLIAAKAIEVARRDQPDRVLHLAVATHIRH